MSKIQAEFGAWTDIFDEISPSEFHGTMSAFACLAHVLKKEQWRSLLSELTTSPPSDEGLLLLEQYGKELNERLSDESLAEFAPLLPDDTRTLDERLLALKDWSAGFIAGIGMANIELSEQELQALEDLVKIAALRLPDHDDSDNHPESAEQRESYYMELYEFVRLVPMLFAVRAK